MKKIVNFLITMFAIFSIGLTVVFMVMSSSYLYVFEEFTINRIILYSVIFLQVLCLFFTDKTYNKLLLVISLILSKDIFTNCMTTILLIIAMLVSRCKSKSVNTGAIISVLTSIFLCFVCFLPCGDFITHFDHEIYSSPDNTKAIVVYSDYSFNKKSVSFPIACQGEKVSVLFLDFYKRVDGIDLGKFSPQEGSGEVVWIDDYNVEINGKRMYVE